MHVAQDDGEVEEKTSCMTPIMSIITQMFDFSLLKSLTFILISGAGVLCFLGTSFFCASLLELCSCQNFGLQCIRLISALHCAFRSHGSTTAALAGKQSLAAVLHCRADNVSGVSGVDPLAHKYFYFYCYSYVVCTNCCLC
jgi:hypothetical protein